MEVTDAGYYQCKARSQDGYSLLSRVSEVLIKHTSFASTVVSSDGVVTNKGRSRVHLVKLSVEKEGNIMAALSVLLSH